MTRIREIRRENNMSQAELASKAGVSRQTINNIENGRVHNADMSTLLGISQVFGVGIDDLFLPEVTNQISQ